MRDQFDPVAKRGDVIPADYEVSRKGKTVNYPIALPSVYSVHLSEGAFQ